MKKISIDIQRQSSGFLITVYKFWLGIFLHRWYQVSVTDYEDLLEALKGIPDVIKDDLL